MEEIVSIANKTKKYIEKNKGKLALLAGAGVLYHMHNRGLLGDAAGWLGDRIDEYSQSQKELKEELSRQEKEAQEK